MAQIKSLGNEVVRKIEKVEKSIQEKKIDKAYYENKKPYLKNYYLENKDVINTRSKDRFKNMNPIERAELAQQRRQKPKRKQVSRGIR